MSKTIKWVHFGLILSIIMVSIINLDFASYFLCVIIGISILEMIYIYNQYVRKIRKELLKKRKKTSKIEVEKICTI